MVFCVWGTKFDAVLRNRYGVGWAFWQSDTRLVCRVKWKEMVLGPRRRSPS